MRILIGLFACAVSLGLPAAACLYLFNPRLALKFLKKLSLLLLGLWVGF